MIFYQYNFCCQNTNEINVDFLHWCFFTNTPYFHWLSKLFGCNDSSLNSSQNGRQFSPEGKYCRLHWLETFKLNLTKISRELLLIKSVLVSWKSHKSRKAKFLNLGRQFRFLLYIAKLSVLMQGCHGRCFAGKDAIVAATSQERLRLRCRLRIQFLKIQPRTKPWLSFLSWWPWVHTLSTQVCCVEKKE